MKAFWVGTALVALGAAWWAVDAVLTTVFPMQWGGPNIGGGFLLLLALAVAGIGVLIAGVSLVWLFLRAPRPPRRLVVLPIAVDVALVVAALVLRAVLPGDAGTYGTAAGSLGVTVDARGNPVLLVEVCGDAVDVDTVTVVGPNRGNRSNAQFAQLHAPAPVTSSAVVPLLDPPAGWTGAPLSLPLATQDFLIASASGRRTELWQVDFRATDLAALDPQTVQYSDFDGSSGDTVARRVARTGWRQQACGAT